MARTTARKGRGGGHGDGAARSPVRGAMVRALLVRGAMLVVLWWALTGGAGGAWFAALLVPVCVGASLVLAPPAPGRVSAWRLLRFVPFFLGASLRGGIDVARRTLDPRLRIAPALCDFHLRVPGERERVLVASMLSLMPGSVSASLEGDRLRVHVLDRALPMERVLRELEAHVAGIFGHALADGQPRARPRRGRRP